MGERRGGEGRGGEGRGGEGRLPGGTQHLVFLLNNITKFSALL